MRGEKEGKVHPKKQASRGTIEYNLKSESECKGVVGVR